VLFDHGHCAGQAIAEAREDFLNTTSLRGRPQSRQANKNDPIACSVVEERQLGEIFVVRDENTFCLNSEGENAHVVRTATLLRHVANVVSRSATLIDDWSFDALIGEELHSPAAAFGMISSVPIACRA